jgi:hypothetical protein
MRLDSSGNLGLGVTPSAWGTQPAIQMLGGAFWGVNAANFDVIQNGYYNGTNYIYRNTNLASRYNQNSGVHSWLIAPSGTAGNAISFTQAMTLDASGTLLVGTTVSTSARVTIRPIGSGYTDGAIRLMAAADGTSNYITSAGGVLYISNNGTTDNLILSAGNLTISGATATKASGTTWANPSDTRLKDNKQLYDKGLNELLQVVVKTWDFNGKGGSTIGEKGLGVIADEIETILPDTVDTYRAKLNPDDETETDIKRFDATEITWLLVNSVKELHAEIESLKQRIN